MLANEMNINFLLKGMSIEEFAVLDDEKISKAEMNFNIGFEIKVDEANKQVGLFLSLELTNDEALLLKLVNGCHFEIQEVQWASLMYEDNIRLPHKFVAHLAMITVGSARGILYSKTENLSFPRIALPLIDVDQIFKEDVNIALQR